MDPVDRYVVAAGDFYATKSVALSGSGSRFNTEQLNKALLFKTRAAAHRFAGNLANYRKPQNAENAEVLPVIVHSFGRDVELA